MKNTFTGLAALAVASGLFAFTKFAPTVIKGKVSPPEGATMVWAMSATDTLKASVANGMFEFDNAKAGTYKVIIDAAAPYKDVEKDNVQVSEGSTTDLGNIVLQK